MYVTLPDRSYARMPLGIVSSLPGQLDADRCQTLKPLRSYICRQVSMHPAWLHRLLGEGEWGMLTVRTHMTNNAIYPATCMKAMSIAETQVHEIVKTMQSAPYVLSRCLFGTFDPSVRLSFLSSARSMLQRNRPFTRLAQDDMPG